MWTIKEAEEVLRQLSIEHLEKKEVNLAELVEAVADFFYEKNIKRYKKDNDGDMLLMEYGTYDFGRGKHFQWSFTRQFYKPTNIQQLQLVLFYDPTIAALKALKATNFWNKQRSKEDWIKDVQTTPAFAIIQELSFINYTIELIRV